MAIETFLLHQELIFNFTHQFFAENPNTFYRIFEEKTDKEFHIRVSDSKDGLEIKKAFGILKFFFTKGHTSFQIQGNTKYNSILHDCREYIIKKTKLPDIQQENRCAVFHNISSESFNDFISLLSSESHWKVTHFGGDSLAIDRVSIQGNYDTLATITYFHTETVTIQGLITSLLIDIYNIAVQLFKAEDASGKGGFLEVIKLPGAQIISDSLDDHFPDRSKFAGTPFEAMIKTSLIMLNSSVILPDYSAMSFGALKALEGVIGLRLHNDIGLGDKEHIGSRFSVDTDPNKWKLSKTNLTPGPLVNAVEDAYSFYHANRNTTFHARCQDPMASIIYPDKGMALGIVEESIKLMNRIIRNW